MESFKNNGTFGQEDVLKNSLNKNFENTKEIKKNKTAVLSSLPKTLELKKNEVLLKYQTISTGRGYNSEYTATFYDNDDKIKAKSIQDSIFMESIHDYGSHTLLLRKGVNVKMYLRNEIREKNFEIMKKFLKSIDFNVKFLDPVSNNLI